MAVLHPRLDDAPAGAEPSAGSLAKGVLRRWPVVLAVFLLTVVAALVAANLAPKTYRATAEVRVSSGNIPSAQGLSSAEANTLLATQVQYLQSTQLGSDVAQRLAGEIEILDVAVEGVPESQVAAVTVVAGSAEDAAEAANTYVVAYDERRDRAVAEEATSRAEQTTAQVERLQARLQELQQQIDAETERVNGELARITIARDAAARAGTVLEPEDVVQPNTTFLSALQGQYNDVASQLGLASTRLEEYQQIAEAANGGVAIVSAATPPSAPSSPGLSQVLALASILGLALGVGAALLLTVLDRRVRSVDDVAVASGGVHLVGPVVGRPDPAAIDLDGLSLPPLSGGTVDSFLSSASWLAVARERGAYDVVLVAAPRGPQTAAPALALALARCGRTVVLVDADLRSPVPGEPDDSRRRGLSDVLLGDALLVDVLVDVDVRGAGSLRVVPAGRAGADVALLAGADMGKLVESLRRDSDVVVLSGAPVMHGREIDVVPVGVDCSLVVATLGVTRRDDLAVAVDHLARTGAALLGVLVADPSLQATSRAAAPTSRSQSGVDSTVGSGSAS